MPLSARSIVHWDGDGFFASIEQASDRKLRNRPVAVGGRGRGVVLSASREAARFGVRAGLPVTRARRLCPALVTVPAHFELYEQFSSQILGLCQERTPLVEPVSVGAAYLDLTGTGSLHGEAAAVVHQLRRTVGQWLRVSLSTGMGSSKSVARIAARIKKPGAEVVVPAGQEAAFLHSLPLGWLPGVGGETLALLQVAGMARIGEMARAPLDALELVLGRRALKLQRLAQGIDFDPVRAPSSGAGEPRWREQIDFAEDAWEEPLLLRELRRMLERLMAQIRAAGCEVRRLTLELRYTDRAESERSVTVPEPTSVENDFFPLLPGLLRAAWQRRVRLRGMRLAASRVYAPSPQMNLFAGPAPRSPVALAAAIDALRRQYGEKVVVRGYEFLMHPIV
ncbi:MAG: DNA polymerase IV [Acidimicrobiia bacterium]|nr:DNA polymerase IV [Acidimicrobiia bacterium]